jgi:hypothetical protein
MRPVLSLVLGAVVACALYSVIFHDTSGAWRTATRLLRSGAQIVGTVTAREPMNHASVRYDYSVDGVSYSGGPCGVGSNFERIQVGDPIAVTYLRQSPSISMCGDAQSAYSNSWGILFVVTPAFCLLAGALSAFALYRWLKPIAPNSSKQSLEPTAGRCDD